MADPYADILAKLRGGSSYDVDISPTDTFDSAIPKFDDKLAELQGLQKSMLPSLFDTEKTKPSIGQTIATALLGSLPLIVGFAGGGKRGAAIGATSGAAAMESYGKQIKDDNAKAQMADMFKFQQLQSTEKDLLARKNKLTDSMLSEESALRKMEAGNQNILDRMELAASGKEDKASRNEERARKAAMIPGFETPEDAFLDPRDTRKLKEEVILPANNVRGILSQLSKVKDPWNLSGPDAILAKQASALLSGAAREILGTGASLTGKEGENVEALSPDLFATKGFFEALKGSAFERDPSSAVRILGQLIDSGEASKLASYSHFKQNFQYPESIIKSSGYQNLFNKDGMYVGMSADGPVVIENDPSGEAMDPEALDQAMRLHQPSSVRNTGQTNGINPIQSITQKYNLKVVP